MATKRARVNKTLEKAKKLISKKGKKKTTKRAYPEGQNAPQSKAYDMENDKVVPAKRTGYRFTKEGAKKLGKQPNDKPTADEIEKYRNETFKVKGKVNKSGPTGVGDGSFRYLYIESRADKSDLNKARKLEHGGMMARGGELYFISDDGYELNISDDDLRKETIKYFKKSMSQKDLKKLGTSKYNSFIHHLIKIGYEKNKMAKGGVVFDPKEVRDFQEHIFYYYGKNGYLVSELEEGVPATTGEVLKAVSQYLAFINKLNQNFNSFYGSMHRHIVHDIIEYNRNPKTSNYYYERVIDDMKKTPILEYGGILQPMIGGVNADPRFDIYNTTMFAKRGAELPYAKGGFVTTIDDVIASADLISEAESKMGEDKMVLNFAYTDYGGDFFDKVAIKFFEENYPDNIVVENTMYSGQNAIVFGEPAREFAEASEKYLLGFDNIEDYYYEMQYEQEREDFERFLEDTEKYDNYKVKPEAINWLMENKSGYYSISPSGLDYSSSDLQEELEKEGLIEKDEYAKGGETKIYEVATKIKGKSGEFASSVRAKSKEDALRIYKQKHGDDKNKVIVDVYETSRKRLEDGGEMAKGGVNKSFSVATFQSDEMEEVVEGGLSYDDALSLAKKLWDSGKYYGVEIIDDDPNSMESIVWIKSKYSGKMADGGMMAKGGKTHEQGYDDREDERLAMRHGKIASKDFVGSHKRREHSRRDDARFETRNK